MNSPERIGITSFRTSNFYFKGELFREKEDFIVQEIENDGEILTINRNSDTADFSKDKKDFLLFTLVKKGCSTQEALKTISRDNYINIKRLGYLGNKDRNAVTAQRISVFKGDANKLGTEYNGFFLKDLVYSDKGCKIGVLNGNRFTIRIREFAGPKNFDAFLGEVKNGILNFYGPQHFGTSALNIELSKSIIKRDFKQAVIDFLFTERDESQTAKLARGVLIETFLDYIRNDLNVDANEANDSLSSLPGFMHSEKDLIKHLLNNKHDYVGAFRTIPKYFRLLMIQSFQAYIFNLALSKLNSLGNLPSTLSTVGYDLELNKLRPDAKEAISSIMKEEKIEDLSKLAIKEMPEASLKTFERETLILPENITHRFEDNNLILSFDLKKGAYATIFLLEMFRHFY